MNKYVQRLLGFIEEWRKPKSEASKAIRKNRKAREEGCYQFPLKLDHFSEFLNLIHKHGDDFFEDGIEAGKQGITHTHFPKLTLAHTEKWQAYAINQALPLLEEKEKELHNLEKDIDQFQAQKILQEQRFLEITNKRKWNRKNFILKEGYVYLVAAIFLMLSDIPLSFYFIKDILDLYLFEKAEYLGRSILSVILILGLAILPFYFKYFFEKYLFPPVEKMRSQFLIEKVQGPDGAVNINNNDRAFIKGTWYLRLAVDLSLFIMVITLLYYLASIRSTAVIVDLKTNGYNFTDSQIKGLIVLISVSLPLVGGILLSSGLLKIQNHNFLKNIIKEINSLKEKLSNAFKTKESIHNNIKTYKHWIEWSSSENFDTSYSDYFMGRFMQGYKQGLEDYPQKSTLYDWAESLRDKELKLSHTKL